MTNYDQIKEILKQFSDKYVTRIIIESKMSDVSEDKAASKRTEKKVLLYEDNRKDMQVIDMDEIAHKAYRVARYPESVKEDDSLASADAFVINADNMWYFIEFKNQEIAKAKDSVTKKAYQNWYWLVDVLREMKDQIQYNNFNYEDPISFARENVVYILVVSQVLKDFILQNEFVFRNDISNVTFILKTLIYKALYFLYDRGREKCLKH